MNSKALLAAAGIAAFAFSPANAYEGLFGNQTKPGAFIGASAGVPPPGIYMFNQVFTYQGNVTGPGSGALNPSGGPRTGANLYVDVQGFLFVPGWTFLGATYDAVIVQPQVVANVGVPVNVQVSGMFDTYIVPVELSWKFGTTGFAVKTGLGIYVPDGTKTGVNGTGNVGSPFYTFQPELILSYLGNGWNLTAALYEEFNTTNTVDHYRSGDIFHADFTATKTIGKWTLGPVAYYFAQVSNDSCPVSCLSFNPTGTLGNAQRFQVWAVGGLVGYDFGPASLSVWATDEVSAKAHNSAAIAASSTGSDPSLIPQGATVFATLSYRLWAPEAPVAPAMYHK
jgi:hypothetical protein